MNNLTINTLILAFAFLLLFASAEFAYRALKLKAEVTRKYVHIGTGLLTMLFPILINNPIWVCALCTSFFILLLVSMKFGFLPSINAVPRKTIGSLLYPIVVFMCFLAYHHYQNYILFYLPILTMALSDPMAQFVGKKWPFGHYTLFNHTKTLSGSAGFLGSAWLISFVFLTYGFNTTLWLAAVCGLAIALAGTIAEAISHHGLDNLTIPLASGAVLLLLFETEILLK